MEGNDFHLVRSLLLPKKRHKKKNMPLYCSTASRTGFTRMEFFVSVKLKNGRVDWNNQNSQLHDHDHLWRLVIRRQTLDQFEVVQVVHQLNLLASSLPLLRTSAFVELAGAHATRFFVLQLKHLAKLPPEAETTQLESMFWSCKPVALLVSPDWNKCLRRRRILIPCSACAFQSFETPCKWETLPFYMWQCLSAAFWKLFFFWMIKDTHTPSFSSTW